ncbi:helix-turn-helix transcriptional regulator [Streptomyces lydicamycinicus]|uniref:Putative transcriptional regulator n=1 Tax=Streptomyces lydicamycinicus TaxID=1546107 RepID=A0A0N7YMG3_9ACTN|nr:helix-turn-helix domain-containing protein [Streptomyces lydicamycinicus]USA00892.1 helix-turn-helix transcriptional regulator [Streptomyces lydicamycinicus]GAO11531.1 putative transcriptional regulator [Streptomyces lydicamycinicus]
MTGIAGDACPIGPVMELLFGRWTADVLWVLDQDGGRVRFGELQRRLPDISPKVLSHTLRQLERNGLVGRTHHPGVPPRVEYAATPLAGTLIPVYDALADWSRAHGGEVLSAQARYDAEESA